MADTTPKTVKAEVVSAWYAKINWTQAVGLGATALALVSGNRYSVPLETQMQIVVLIQSSVAVATWIFRTWFNRTVPPGSL